MFPIAVLGLVAGVALGGIPYWQIGPWIDVGLERKLIEPFGVLLAGGVLLGAEILRRYGLRRNVSDEHIRGLSWYVLVGGFIGAHVFDVLMYQRDKLAADPVLLIKLWAGISSYGGFIGGITGFFVYVLRRKMWVPMLADMIVIGLVPGFTIGRLGCTVVHDHPGRATDFWLAVDYPARFAQQHGFEGATRMHNLGLYEFLYLLPVCALILSLAFSKKRLPAGFLAVLTGTLYAPVRFFLDYLRLNDTDPRYAGLTFAQWMSMVAAVVSVTVLVRVLKKGKVAPLAAEIPGKLGGFPPGSEPDDPDAKRDAAPKKTEAGNKKSSKKR